MHKLIPLAIVLLGSSVATAPAVPPRDRDGDRLPDAWERRYGLSVVKAQPWSDPDRDGLSNRSEYLRRLHPRRADTDGDGLSDGREVRRHRTNPRRRDTDRDGFTDGVEVRAGSDPRSARSVPRGRVPQRPAPESAPPGPPGAAATTPPPSMPPTLPVPDGPTLTPVPPTPPTPITCDRTAAPGALAAVFTAAAPGQTICLQPGDHGTFRGGEKAGVVFVRPLSGAAARMRIDFTAAANIVLDGVTVTGADMQGRTRAITVRNSAFTGSLTIDGLTNADILLDRNTHVGIDADGQFESPARIHLSYASATPSGVTVRNSLLAGGDADGIQSGAGLNVLGNEFRDILESGGPNHTDAIQLLGARGSVLRGNWIHNSATGIVAYDGLDAATIEDNVLDLPERPWAIELYADDGSLVRHNTLRYRSGCEYNLPCGILALDRKSGDPAGRGTVVTDNIATEIVLANGSAAAARHHNLVRRNVRTGDVLGTPIFTGGAAPASFSGYRLAAGSPGKGAASDAGDVGIR